MSMQGSVLIVAYTKSWLALFIICKQYNYHYYLLLLEQQMKSTPNTSSTASRSLPQKIAATNEFYQQVLNQFSRMLRIHYQHRCDGLTGTQIDHLQQKVEQLLTQPHLLFRAANNYTQFHGPINQTTTPNYSFQIKTADEIGIFNWEREKALEQGKIKSEKEMIMRQKEVNTCRVLAEDENKQEGTKASIQQESQQASELEDDEENYFKLTEIKYRIAGLYEDIRYISKGQKWKMNLSDVFVKTTEGQFYIYQAKFELENIGKEAVKQSRSH